MFFFDFDKMFNKILINLNKNMIKTSPIKYYFNNFDLKLLKY